MKSFFKKKLNTFGFDLIRYPHGEENQIAYYLTKYDIDTVFDLGANKGQYGSLIRSFGYTKQIISFEPIKSVFEILKNKTNSDNNWDIYNLAIGNKDELTTINIAALGQDVSPVTSFYGTANVPATNSFTFNNTSTIAHGSIVGLVWDFGDGTTDTKSNVTHVYTQTGKTYIIKLTATASSGCISSTSSSCNS